MIFAAVISPEGRSASLFERSDKVALLASPHVVEEARRNVVARYPEAIDRFTDLLPRLVVGREPPSELIAWAREQGLPDNDAPVLAAAVHGEADVLVTGDRRHFGHLFGRTVRGVRVARLRDVTGPGGSGGRSG